MHRGQCCELAVAEAVSPVMVQGELVPASLKPLGDTLEGLCLPGFHIIGMIGGTELTHDLACFGLLSLRLITLPFGLHAVREGMPDALLERREIRGHNT